jgi:cell fate regulator YaaT (PSP1 superfamily)
VEREDEALKICKERIKHYKLPMKLVRVEYLFDSSKAIFYFTSEMRVDFRDLVKDLASRFYTRIEMRQIGVRDEAKMTGGMGPCSRELCCATFLSDFEPVTVKMAKQQNVALNPAKVSGVCGRLMCCLSYEHMVGTVPGCGPPGAGERGGRRKRGGGKTGDEGKRREEGKEKD